MIRIVFQKSEGKKFNLIVKMLENISAYMERLNESKLKILKVQNIQTTRKDHILTVQHVEHLYCRYFFVMLR